jgi:hypothetical protein
MPEVVLFAGPSAYGIDRALIEDPAIDLRPPVRRGDVDRLLAEGADARVVVVCDGVFHVEPAVSHAELCRAIDAGWQVWGVSSIGAIRAHELRAEGMHGFGFVHAQFERFDDFTDDEMCLLHFPEPPFFPVSVALVDLRYALAQRGRDFGIAEAVGDALVTALRGLWFGDRTEERIEALLREQGGVDPRSAGLLLDWLRQHRVKAMDLAQLLACRPWRDPREHARTP